jgi:hypothetical protein
MINEKNSIAFKMPKAILLATFLKASEAQLQWQSVLFLSNKGTDMVQL